MSGGRSRRSLVAAIVAVALLPLAAAAQSLSVPIPGPGVGLPFGLVPLSEDELGTTVARGPQRPPPPSQQRSSPRVKLWDELAAARPAEPQGSQGGMNSIIVSVRTTR